jgi:hypothetical protein
VTDRFEPFAAYCAARLVEDPHVWATTLFDELLELGYEEIPYADGQRNKLHLADVGSCAGSD